MELIKEKDEIINELLKNLKACVHSLEYWFPRWGDPEGANSQMMKDARAIIKIAEEG